MIDAIASTTFSCAPRAGLADDTRPYDDVPTKKDRRIVYVEQIDLA